VRIAIGTCRAATSMLMPNSDIETIEGADDEWADATDT
jgi:hypothetical protein